MSQVSLLSAAKHASQQGRWEQAEELARQAVEAAPLNVQPKMVVGIICYNRGDTSGALDSFKGVLELEPNNFAALNWAGMLSQATGDFTSALRYSEQAIALAPDDPEPHFNLGTCYAKMGRTEDALPPLKRAVKLQPNRQNFLYGLATVLLELNRRPEAIDVLKQAVQLFPTEAGFVDLMDAQLRIGRPDETLRTGEVASRIYPKSAPIQIMISRGFEELGDPVQSETHLDHSHILDPNRPEFFILKGKRAQQNGDFSGAERFLRRAIDLDPALGHPYLSIVAARKIGRDDLDLVEQMRKAASNPTLHPSQRPPLLFALAKAFDNLGDYETAMIHYDLANEAQRLYFLRHRPYDAERTNREVSQKVALYNSEFFQNVSRTATKNDLPILVLGMMRSGTTLVEQILSAHPKIGGAGEVPFWASREDWYFDFSRGLLDLPAISKAGYEYVDLLASKIGDRRHVTDKNPANVMAAGMIHAALPNARIIHTKRNPVDTALSMWMTPVDNPPAFCCDRKNIVHMYRAYQRISNHWRSVLPKDRYLEVSYEQLTEEPEATIRQMLEFLGVEWDERCLHPEENQRTVNTPSLWQVRQPLYRTSVAKWKHYEPWISEFLELQEPESL
jgi:tetratricopeptide (TPR) repeat protein